MSHLSVNKPGFEKPELERIGLEKRIREANKCNGITNPDYINRVLDQLRDAQSIEINVWDDDCDCVGLHEGVAIEFASEEYDFEEPEVETMTFGTFLFILSKALMACENDPSLGENKTDRKSTSMSIFLSTMQYGATHNSLIMQLRDINYGALCEQALQRYVRKKKRNPKTVRALQRQFCSTDSRSFDQVINTINRRTKIHWAPNSSIAGYRQDIEKYYDAIEYDIFLPLYLASSDEIPVYKL